VSEPAEPVVHAGPDDVSSLRIVGGNIEGASHKGRNVSERIRDGLVPEAYVLVFDLGRPVRRERIFDARADGVA
jgi:hypothetical protein